MRRTTTTHEYAKHAINSAKRSNSFGRSNQFKLKRKVNMDMKWFDGSSLQPTLLPGDQPTVVRSSNGDVVATIFPNDPCDPNTPHARIIDAMLDIGYVTVRQSQARRAAGLTQSTIISTVMEWQYNGKFPFRKAIEKEPKKKQELLDLLRGERVKPVKMAGYNISITGRLGPNPTLKIKNRRAVNNSQHPPFVAHNESNILPKKALMRALNDKMREIHQTIPNQYENIAYDASFDGTNDKQCFFTRVFGTICKDVAMFEKNLTNLGVGDTEIKPSKRLTIHFNGKESVVVPFESDLITDFNLLHGSESTGSTAIDNTIPLHRDNEKTNRTFSGMLGCGPVNGLMVRGDRIRKRGFPPSMCWLFYRKNSQRMDFELDEHDLREYPYLTRYGYETYVLKKMEM
jgi:hypothetical protein